jgi:putative membrane fusion protein
MEGMVVSNRKARLKRKILKRSALKIVLLSCLALLIMGFIYQLGHNTYSIIVKLNRNIKVAEYGHMEDKISGEAIVLYKEELASAQFEGRFENMVKDREKTRKGTLLGYYISSRGQTPLRAPISGIFMRRTDGLEEVFREINLQAVSPEIFNYQTSIVAEDKPIQPGQPVYKIVNNLEPIRLLVHFPIENLDFDIVEKQQVKVFLVGKDLGRATVKELKTDFGEMLMILEFNDFQEQLLNQRYIKIELVFDSRSGYLVPEKALVEKEGKKGIYCTKDEDIIFKPVDIIKIKDGKAVVEGLNKNDMVVINPPQ